MATKTQAALPATGASKKKPGKPRAYDREAVVKQVCEILSTSELGVANILRDNPDTMPTLAVFWGWLDEKDKEGNPTEEAYGFQESYTRAKRLQAEYMASLILDIADDSRNDYMEKQTKDGSYKAVDQEHIQRTRLRVDTRKWLMAKLHPKQYADSVKIGGSEELPPVRSETTQIVTFDALREAMDKVLGKKP